MKISVVMLSVGASLAFVLYLFLKLISVFSKTFEPKFYDCLAIVMYLIFPRTNERWRKWAARKRDGRIFKLEIQNRTLDKVIGA